ncbi:MAG: AAA family ATPase [Archaeoglobaceae archaeon]
MVFRASYTTLIRNPFVFEEDYVPPRLSGRVEQLEMIKRAVLPAFKNRWPENLLVYGPPGTGKTCLLRYVMEEFRRNCDKPIAYVNCWELKSSYNILSNIVMQIGGFPSPRISTRVMLDSIRRIVGENSFILILDEIDQLDEKSALLYSFSNIGKTGIIAASNTDLWISALDKRVRSRFIFEPVYFPPYRVRDIVEILRPRAEIGLAENSVDEEIIEKIAELASGDARLAIQMLRKAAENAELGGRRRICEEDVRDAWEKFRRQRQSYLLSKLNRDQHMLYEIIERSGGIESGEIYRKYAEKAAEMGIKPIAPRTIRKYLAKLIELGLVSAENAHGRKRVFRCGDGNTIAPSGTNGTEKA